MNETTNNNMENDRNVDNSEQTVKKELKIPSPREIKDYLDQYVIGQDEVKRTLSVAVYNHYRRIQANFAGCVEDEYKDVEVEKSNILLLGGSGTGKTLMAKTLAKFLHVPFAIADATTLTQAGYVGEDVENIVRYLWQNSEYNVGLTQIGIVYVDEIDKIASKTDNVSITRDVSGEGVQQSLLKIVEGTICRFPPNGGRKHPDQKLVEIDTSNILFICGGAFVGLDKIIKQRNNKNVIGYGNEDVSTKSGISENVLLDALPEDLIKFGLIPEFIGRLPILTATNELDENQLLRIMTEPKNSLIKQYSKLFSFDKIKLNFTDGALRKIARNAIKRKTGARGLKAEFDKIMTDIMFENYGSNTEKTVTIWKDLVK